MKFKNAGTNEKTLVKFKNAGANEKTLVKFKNAGTNEKTLAEFRTAKTKNKSKKAKRHPQRVPFLKFKEKKTKRTVAKRFGL